jgi:cereblon
MEAQERENSRDEEQQQQQHEEEEEEEEKQEGSFGSPLVSSSSSDDDEVVAAEGSVHIASRLPREFMDALLRHRLRELRYLGTELRYEDQGEASEEESVRVSVPLSATTSMTGEVEQVEQVEQERDEDKDEEDEKDEKDEEDEEQERECEEEGASGTAFELASTHSYLKEAEEVAGRTFVDSGQELLLPLLCGELVLFPGNTLPLHCAAHTYSARLVEQALERAPDETRHLFGVLYRTPRYVEQRVCFDEGTVGTVAELELSGKQVSSHSSSSDSDEDALHEQQQSTRDRSSRARRQRWSSSSDRRDCGWQCVSRGRARFQVLERLREHGLEWARVRVLDEEVGARLPTGIRAERWALYYRQWEGGRRARAVALGHLPPFTFAHYDVVSLRARAVELVAKRLAFLAQSSARGVGGAGASGASVMSRAPRDPTAFSYWLVAQMPIGDHFRQQMLEQPTTYARLHAQLRKLAQLETSVSFTCQNCTQPLATLAHLITMSSEGVQSSFVNSGGCLHQTLTVSRVHNALLEGAPSTVDSWFPGYAWTILRCGRCWSHVGWRFDCTSPALRPPRFYGLTSSAIAHKST